MGEKEFNEWLADNEGMIRKLARVADIPGYDEEDVAQELRLKAWDVLSRGIYDPGRGVKLSTFMYAVLSAKTRELYRNAVSEARGGGNRPQSLDQSEDGQDPYDTLPADGDTVEEIAAYHDLAAALDRALKKLPLNTRYFAEQSLAGYTQRETAARAGRSQPAAAYHIRIFRNAVRRELSGENPHGRPSCRNPRTARESRDMSAPESGGDGRGGEPAVQEEPRSPGIPRTIRRRIGSGRRDARDAEGNHTANGEKT